MKVAAAQQPQGTDLARRVARGGASGRRGGLGPQGVAAAAPAELAGHYCLKCTAIAFRDDPRCVYCDSPPPAQGWARLERAKDPWLGQILGARYLLTRRIARGPAARVYEAESLHIHRQFAIKIIDFGPDAQAPHPEVVRARLRREIAAMSRLRHPHIVHIIEVLSVSESSTALVMEFIGAPTLARLLRGGPPLGWARACRILRQVAIASHAAHQAGMVHRDLKPANILVETMAGGDDFIHLLDFGIVWMDDGVAITHGFVGTPLYASPEQARGAPIDPRSDIYSLGVIFFEMLVGHPPFQHARVKQVLRMHVQKPAPGLLESAPNRAFPPPLPQLLEEMLQKQPQKRPSDMLALIDALDSLLDARQVLRPDRRLSQPGAPPLRLPAIPQPRQLTGADARARAPIPDAPRATADPRDAEITRVGHGVLDIFSSADAPKFADIARPVFAPKIDYNRSFS